MTTGGMRLETFSFLPPLTEEQLLRQIGYILDRGLIPAVEHTSEPGPRNVYWSMWGLPLFGTRTVEEVLATVNACAAACPADLVRLIGYDPRRQGQVASFVVRRPAPSDPA
jgi:ribulose-bisphosphate carboxylase small chain